MRKRRLCAAAAVLAALAMLSFPAAGGAAKKRPPHGPVATTKGVQKLEPTALRRWPASFGGIWLSHGKLFVAFTGESKKRMRKLRRPLTRTRRLGKDRFRAVTVDDSLASLRVLLARMIADRDAPPPPSIVGFPRPEYDLEIDVIRNSVVVTAPAVTPELVNGLRSKYGDVIVEQGPLIVPQAVVGCPSRDNCYPFLRSGLMSHAESGSSCSLAFNVLYKPGVTGMLSAAHCGNPDANVGDDQTIGGEVYGQVVAEQQSGKLDAELHSVGNNGFISLFPMIYRSSTDYAAIVGKVGTYDGLLIGSTVCKSGYKTGETCGKVLSKTASPSKYVPGANDFIRTDLCSDHGDSGAGVYSSFQRKLPNKSKPVTRYEALGIHSGATDDPCASSEHSSVFGHIEFVQQALGVKVLSNPK